MAIGIPAYYKDRQKLIFSVEETKALALECIKVLEWQEIGLHPYALDYKSKGTIMTSGERIYVNITDAEIILRSECLIITRIFDFGKNKQNINEFWAIYNQKCKEKLSESNKKVQ